MPQGKHLRGASAKEQRQYEHILEGSKKEGRYGKRAKEVAARTVMKQHGEEGHPTHSSSSGGRSGSGSSSSRRGTGTRSRTTGSTRRTASARRSTSSRGTSRTRSTSGRASTGGTRRVTRGSGSGRTSTRRTSSTRTTTRRGGAATRDGRTLNRSEEHEMRYAPKRKTPAVNASRSRTTRRSGSTRSRARTTRRAA